MDLGGAGVGYGVDLRGDDADELVAVRGLEGDDPMPSTVPSSSRHRAAAKNLNELRIMASSF